MEYKEKNVILKDGSQCTLRSPKQEDAEAMIHYMVTISEETYFMLRYPEEVCTSILIQEERIKEYLNSETNFFIAAYIDDQFVGNIGITKVGIFSKMKHRATLGVSVLREYCGKGIGDCLVKEALNEAKKIGYKQVELGVFVENEKAQNLYKKYGFEVWGTTKNAFRLKDGTYHDELQMGVLL